MPDAPHSVEYAKSGRAKCKVCKGLIAKDALRCGTASFFRGVSSVNWSCVGCWKMPKKLTRAADLHGFALLREADRQRLRALVGGDGGGDGGGGGGGGGGLRKEDMPGGLREEELEEEDAAGAAGERHQSGPRRGSRRMLLTKRTTGGGARGGGRTGHCHWTATSRSAPGLQAASRQADGRQYRCTRAGPALDLDPPVTPLHGPCQA